MNATAVQAIETAEDANKKAVHDDMISPRFYTTDFAAMDRINIEPVRAEWDKMMAEYEGDNNHDHFQRDEAFAGEVASMLAIEAIEDVLEKDVFTSGMSDQEISIQFDQLFLNAHQSLMERGEEDPRTDGMGTTLVVGLLMDMHLHLAWLGDSRCNLYRAGPGFEYISRDHSYVQMLVDAGRITHEQAFDHPGSNIITRSLMCVAGDDPTPEHKTIKLEVGDRLLFCSDGLNGMLRDREIAQIMAEEQDTRGCVQRLVSAANDRGGKDNISVVLVDLKQVKMGMSLN